MTADTDRHDDTATVRTGRLVLRAPCLDDADAIAALADNWNVVRNLAVLPFPYRREHARAWIEDMEAKRERGSTVFAVCLADEAASLIGICGCAPPEDSEVTSFGYWLGEPYWGRGYATEAVRALLGHVLARYPEIETVVAGCHKGNEASRRVMEKCGFRVVGEHVEHSLARGEDMPSYTMQLRRADAVTASAENA